MDTPGPSFVGSRFSVPCSSVYSHFFLEMRRIGHYPGDLFFSLLFSYFETCFDLSVEFDLVVLQCLLQNDASARYYYSFLAQKRSLPSFLDDREVQIVLRQVCDYAVQTHGLQMNNEQAVIESVSRLRTLLKLNISVETSAGAFPNLTTGNVFVQKDQNSDDRELVVCISDPQKDRRIFVLYPYMSKCSFVRLDCGHHTLKRLIYKHIADYSRRNYAVSSEDLRRLELRCNTCSVPYSIAGVQGDENGLVIGRSNPDSLFTQCTHQAAPIQTLKCQNCSAHFCPECAVMRSLLAKGPVCARCNASYADQLEAGYGREQYAWVNELLAVVLAGVCRRQTPTAKSSQDSDIESGCGKRINRTGSSSSIGGCEGYKGPKTDESPCNAKDLCMSCFYKFFFEQKNNVKCPNCSGTLNRRLVARQAKCVACAQKDRLEDFFHWCYDCKKGVCCACVKKKPEQYETCEATKGRHVVDREKVKEILGKKSEAFRYLG